MTLPYGKTATYGGEMFTVSAFLVLCNRCFNCVFASSMIYTYGESVGPKAPLYKYFIISMSNVAATTCQYECLKYVSFPVQMLGKSFKMMPVMIWGIIISGKKHTMLDWLVAAIVSMCSVLAMGKMSYCLAFAAAHSTFVFDTGLLSAAAAASQYFIYSQVKEYGALVFA